MRDPEAVPRVETGLVYAHGLAALATLFVSVAFGIFASIQLLAPEIGAGTPWLGWGRLRYAQAAGRGERRETEHRQMRVADDPAAA
jgi:hypothetical protein